MTKIAVIGVGHMGSAIIKGLVKSSPDNIIIGENPTNPRVNDLAQQLGFDLIDNLLDLNNLKPDIVILTTPAPLTLQVAKGLDLDKKTIIISAAAGVSYEDLHTTLPNNPVARIIPNIPVSINSGTIGLFLPEDMESDTKVEIEDFLAQLGDIITVKEDQLSIVGTIAGCGPAFVDVFLDALGNAGVLNGLSRSVANKLAASMVKGSSSLAYDSPLAPAQLRDQVCSPGGTTIKGVVDLEKNGFRYSIISAINKANEN